MTDRSTISPAQMAKRDSKTPQENPQGYTCFGSGVKTEPQKYVKEHQMVPSRLGNRAREVSFGPTFDGLVPANPFLSKLQSAFAHANPSKFGGKKGLKEWDKSTNYGQIPAKKQHLK